MRKLEYFQVTEGHPVANSRQLHNALKNQCSSMLCDKTSDDHQTILSLGGVGNRDPNAQPFGTANFLSFLFFDFLVCQAEL